MEHPAHSRYGLLLGGEVQVSINVGGGGEGAVAQPDLYLFHRDAVTQQKAGTSVPLWHNKDKSENPCVATGWRFVLILFPLKTALKWGLREGVKNQGCT